MVAILAAYCWASLPGTRLSGPATISCWHSSQRCYKPYASIGFMPRYPTLSLEQ